MEIVAPAGDYTKLEAAILGGADSVYLGLKGFGARRKAGNFNMEELKAAIDMAHIYNVKIYLTLNTIFRDSEIESLYENVKTLYEYGLDAFIVQDFGMALFLKRNFPLAELHGSTQMTVTNHVEAQFLKDLGFKRVVLARELSFEEIKTIKEKVDIDLEIFVSGALCISYSGNCYFSSFIGSRSGNRGMCAQPCRKKYRSGNTEGYFLSPKDQMLKNEEIEKLKKIGVESIKVEGRMKSMEYVYAMTAHYKNILLNNDTDDETHKIFNRGYSKGYFYNKENLINSSYSFDMGTELGKAGRNQIKLKENLSLGDGIVFLDKNFNKIGGNYVNKISVKGQKQEKALKGETVDLSIPKNTAHIYKNFDKSLMDSLKHKLKTHRRKEGISIKLHCQVDSAIKLELNAWGNEVEVTGPILEEAKKSIDLEKIKEKISELGETPFFPLDINIDYDSKAFVPFKLLKQIRREGIELLCAKLKNSKKRRAPKKWILEKDYSNKNSESQIRASVKYQWQKEILKNLGIEEVFIKDHDIIRESMMDKLNKNNLLASNICQLLTNKNDKITLDWNQNISNSYALYALKSIKNLDTVAISPEIKKEDLEKIDSFGIKKELLIYGHLKLMYIETDINADRIINEEKDEFIILKNEAGNSEIYYSKAMNLIPKLDIIQKLGYDKLRLEFTIENEDDIRSIIGSLKTKKGNYTPYNFEKGVY